MDSVYPIRVIPNDLLFGRFQLNAYLRTIRATQSKRFINFSPVK